MAKFIQRQQLALSKLHKQLKATLMCSLFDVKAKKKQVNQNILLTIILNFQYLGTWVLIQKRTVQKMKFSIKDLVIKYDQKPQETADLVTFAEEIINGKLLFFV